ncbi:MAG: phosphoglycerate mutase family protein [Parcubacteria group bacterium]|nr:phosphoglycerate mutase family protein [Parcubacteria group bacterium]
MFQAVERPSLLVIVRHAESERNAAKKGNVYFPDEESAACVRGVPDHEVPITTHGVQQAEITGVHIRRQFGMFDVVYDSGYLRTQQTRDEILKAYTLEELKDMKLRTSDLIRERDTGYTYDMTTAEVDTYFPWLRVYWKEFGYFYARPPGGESQSDVCERVYRFIGTLFSIRAGQKVLVVTHGGTARAFRYNLERWTGRMYVEKLKEAELKNCGCIVYVYNPVTGRLEFQEHGTAYWERGSEICGGGRS